MKELSNNFKRYFRVYLSIEKNPNKYMCASVHIQKILSFTSSNLDALLNHLKKIEKISTDIEFMKAHVIP